MCSKLMSSNHLFIKWRKTNHYYVAYGFEFHEILLKYAKASMDEWLQVNSFKPTPIRPTNTNLFKPGEFNFHNFF